MVCTAGVLAGGERELDAVEFDSEPVLEPDIYPGIAERVTAAGHSRVDLSLGPLAG